MNWIPVAITAAGIEASLVGAAWLGGNQKLPAMIALVMLSHVFYLVSCFWFQKNKAVASNGFKTAILLGGALVFRLSAWPAFPALSQDVFRYRWEGMVQARGGNPYLEAPVEKHIPGAGFRAGYGPTLELVEWGNFSLARRLGTTESEQAFWMKLPAATFELATLALLRGLPAERLIFYAWSPLPIVEFWWNGHNDAVPVFFVVVAVLAAARARWSFAYAALGVAVAAKWWPAFLLPVFLWRSWKPMWLAALPLGFTGWLYWTPRWSQLIENAQFMSGFVGGWRNNDSLYGLLLWISGDVYRAKYAAFVIAALAAAYFGRWPIEEGVIAITVVLLLVSANCHPWYLTWLAPMLVWRPWPPLLLWAALAPLFYRVLADWQVLGEWNGSTPDRWWVWGPVLGAMACWTLRGRGNRSADRAVV